MTIDGTKHLANLILSGDSRGVVGMPLGMSNLPVLAKNPGGSVF